MGVPPTKYMLLRVLEGKVERDVVGVPAAAAAACPPTPTLAIERVGKGAEGVGVDESTREEVPLGVEDTLSVGRALCVPGVRVEERVPG